jgi:prolycopene isomerase
VTVAPPTEMPPEENLRCFLRNPLGVLRLARMMFTSAKQVITRFVTDPEVLGYFDKLTSTYCYCTVAETPTILAATMFIDNHEGGGYYPVGSPQMLSNKLERAFERYGGQALYRRMAHEILIADGLAHGVRLADGLEIAAERVVANATVWDLYVKLVKPEHIKPERIQWAQALAPTYGAMVLYVWVDAEAIPAGALPVEMFVENPSGVDSQDVTVYSARWTTPPSARPGRTRSPPLLLRCCAGRARGSRSTTRPSTRRRSRPRPTRHWLWWSATSPGSAPTCAC